MSSPNVASVRRPIPLTRGHVAWVSPEDYHRVLKRKWCVHKHRNGRNYAQTNMKVEGKWRRVLLHRFILGASAGSLVDHKNGDGLDCTRENLRPATRGQNQYNSGPRKGRFKGVTWHKRAGKWLAQISVDRKYRYLGLFTDEREAADAYDAAAKVLHGQFSRPNLPKT